MAILEHKGECVGLWGIILPLGIIACRRCGAAYPHSPEREFAALFDCMLAAHAQNLARDGAEILDAERGR